MADITGLESLGFALPSPAYIFGSLLFGIVGYAAYRYGKHRELPIPKWIGVTLMLYPYAISATWLLYAIGCALCAGLFFFRE